MEAPLKKAGSIWADFKKFAMQGNMIDLAVGVIIGTAFGAVVNSLVKDVMMPPLGALLGGVDFSDKVIHITQKVVDAAGNTVKPAVDLKYGSFINTIINFLIVAASIFAMVKLISLAKHETPVPPGEPTSKECPKCLSTIPIKASRCAHCCADLATA
jgi:large conductance mechanosensitive channel